MSDYLFDKSGHDPEIAALEAALGAYAHQSPLRPLPPRPGPRRRAIAAAALACCALVAAIAFALWHPGSGAAPGCPAGGDGFAFSVLGGPARCGGEPTSAGSLPVGAWLETTGDAVADVQIADLGALTVYGDSRLRPTGSNPAERRFELVRGRVSARVLAPPRLFVIDTPVAAAVDLGCAYDLEVDADGRTHLRVTSGAVSLEGRGRRAYVPRGAEVVATPGRGPGTPVATGAAEAFRRAVERFDAGAASGAALAALAGPNDTVTLWNLLSRTEGEGREAAFRRLDELATRPPGVTAEDVLAGRPGALEDWRQDLDSLWLAH
jgi:FecR-like protein